MRIAIVSWIIIMCLQVSVSGQKAINNNIEERIELKLESDVVRSTTRESDVQWNCINKNLTHKCLIYHNDQWFSYKPLSAETAYLRISNQKCRDQLGVQLVIIEGDPCKTTSYKLKKCIDFTDQADFCVMLDSLRMGQEYLINVDGYLGDICEFDIAITRTPSGVPISSPLLSGAVVSAIQQDSIVQLQWTVSDSAMIGAKDFTIYRKKNGGRRSAELRTPAIRNAYGVAAKNYSVADTLQTKGDYAYSIFIHRDDGVFLLEKKMISYQDVYKTPVYRSTKRTIDYFSRDNGSVLVKVLDEEKKPLFSFRHRSVHGKNTITLDFAPYIERGSRKFIVTIKGKHIDEGRSVSF
jgi:hypothetical protein